jgi:branched-chain amino acid transport system ATP-binding protein
MSPKSGTIRLMGEELSKFPSYKLAGMGMAHVPEGRKVFATLTVDENLNLGTWGVRNQFNPPDTGNKGMDFHFIPILKTRRNNSRHTFRREQQMLAISKA